MNQVLRIGILAFHGAVEEHARTLGALGAQPVEVRQAEDTENLDGLILPGGESTAFTLAIENNGLGEALRTAMGNDLPVFGTCAGAILLARGGALEQLPIRAKRNAYGPQLASGTHWVQLCGAAASLKKVPATITKSQRGLPPLWLQHSAAANNHASAQLFPGIFIRAPRFQLCGADAAPVEVLGTCNEEPVLLRHGRCLICSFHPELTGDSRIHQLFLGMCVGK